MVSDRKKKRSAAAAVADADMSDDHIEPVVPSPKKSKKSASPSPKKSSKLKKAIKKEPDEEEEPFWPEQDLQELIRRIEVNIPAKDQLKYDSRALRLSWQDIAFGEYDGERCKHMWFTIQKRLRRFRLLKEIVEDAKTWVSQPWTNFYRSHKQNRHPDQPRRPLSTYMIFYLEKKDKVAKENPTLEMTEISKQIALMYKNLSEKQKQKFVQKAAQQRQEYETKLQLFYKEHPELIPKVVKREKPTGQTYPGPKKPRSPFQMYSAEEMDKHKKDASVNKVALMERIRDDWKAISNEKRIYWINAALDDENRYKEELKTYMEENPDFSPLPLKPILTRSELILKQRDSGKPDKPPNSGYSLYSRMMLQSEDIKKIDSKQRMTQISAKWKDLNPRDKKKYNDKVQEMLEKYKLDFATYLETLPPEKKEEELRASQHRKKPATSSTGRKRKVKVEAEEEEDEDDFAEGSSEDDDAAAAALKHAKSASKASTKKIKMENDEEIELYKGEPVPPPAGAYKLFLRGFVKTSGHIPAESRSKEALERWQALPESEKSNYRKKLAELKQIYIANYENFLKGLTQEELKEYSTMKQKVRSEDSESDEDNAASENASEEEDDEGQQSDEDSDSDGTSSGSDSDTEESSSSDSESESDSD